ncbi:MAG: hypothetical protein K9H64_19410 [Bacteroidales bacterium]|nr:hypothetical protein [Bacteroidales bacterium]MCF8458240.1 hypothetical protein [Bacteroidales bacterium]
MKKTSLVILLTISTLFLFFLSCKEKFPADEVIGDWQIEKFQYFKPDTSFAANDVYSDSVLNSLTLTDSLFDTIATRFGWYHLSLYENLSLYSVEITGDSAYGYWERLTDTDIRVWVNGRFLNWEKVDNDNYNCVEYKNDKRDRQVSWKRTN